MNVSDYTVLLVEDDENDVVLIRRALEKAGVVNPIRVVGDGETAIAYLFGEGTYANREANPLPALVLLDLKLPRLSGFEVLERVKTEPRLKRIPVVILTSSELESDIRKAYDLHANSYLVKPVTFDSLAELMRSSSVYWLILNEKPPCIPPRSRQEEERP